ncbi:MAG: hydrogenase nickel incorporation protein HypB [Methylococcus sp.]|nr:hydrogenase nickel incorporation protein HypB [Methylococcus sp.]
MCDTCGCNITEGNRHLLRADGSHAKVTAVSVLNKLLQHNDDQAQANRALLDSHGVLTINLMSSPGSGKTSLLEATIKALKGALRIAVIEGDLETENDAARIRALGVEAHQITTGTACHLDAHLVAKVLPQLELEHLDVLFIENVGNLVCPASFDLGHHLNLTLLSVTEGDDKPAKYPVMFRAADAMLLSKTDLLTVLEEFSPERAEACLRNLASKAPVIRVSAKTGEGMQEWLGWLYQRLEHYREMRRENLSLRPAVQSEGRKLHGLAQPELRFKPVSKLETV